MLRPRLRLCCRCCWQRSELVDAADVPGPAAMAEVANGDNISGKAIKAVRNIGKNPFCFRRWNLRPKPGAGQLQSMAYPCLNGASLMPRRFRPI
jgi:hypothetical protein